MNSVPSREYIETSDGEREASRGQVQVVELGPDIQGLGKSEVWWQVDGGGRRHIGADCSMISHSCL